MPPTGNLSLNKPSACCLGAGGDDVDGDDDDALSWGERDGPNKERLVSRSMPLLDGFAGHGRISFRNDSRAGLEPESFDDDDDVDDDNDIDDDCEVFLSGDDAKYSDMILSKSDPSFFSLLVLLPLLLLVLVPPVGFRRSANSEAVRLVLAVVAVDSCCGRDDNEDLSSSSSPSLVDDELRQANLVDLANSLPLKPQLTRREHLSIAPSFPYVQRDIRCAFCHQFLVVFFVVLLPLVSR